MVSERLLIELNKQMNAEFESAYIYLSMSAYLEDQNMSGMAAWMNAQHNEEREHALKFFTFIQEINEKPELDQFSKPKSSWGSIIEVFEETLAHEKLITSRINKLYDIAMEEKNYSVKVFLDWFITEQVEEESVATGILDQIKMIQDSPQGLFFLDKELGSRKTTE
ncbi:MAG: ferritin [Candidatus Kariarchaeaceae archaeon]|jgi:ferritin